MKSASEGAILKLRYRCLYYYLTKLRKTDYCKIYETALFITQTGC